MTTMCERRDTVCEMTSSSWVLSGYEFRERTDRCFEGDEDERCEAPDVPPDERESACHTDDPKKHEFWDKREQEDEYSEWLGECQGHDG